MGRRPISPTQIQQQLDDQHSIAFPDRYGGFRVTKLHSNLMVPPHTHGYSLGIEYMKQWFLEKFPKDYFKTVHINGKHVFDDQKHFDKQRIKRECPMVAIMPTIDYDYDRENIDFYMGDPQLFLKRSNYQKSFFKDYERNLYVGMQMRALRMNFTFKVRVRTRALQTDLLRKMELAFRIGCTQQEYLSADFHIPREVLMDIAKKTGFEVTSDGKGGEQVDDILAMLSYLNSHSELPIMFKMKAINQKPEFFVRVRDLPAHISCMDKISVDDGERDGHLDTNFHLEMQAILTIPVPYFFVYYSADEMIYNLPVTKEGGLGLYSFCKYDIPMENDRGWGQLAVTSYQCDEGEQEIDMSPIFKGNGNLHIVMENSLKNFISPAGYIEILAFHTNDVAMLVKCRMDYETLTLHLLEPMKEENINIVIYGDKEYINDTIISLQNYHKNRISKENLTIGDTTQTTVV